MKNKIVLTYDENIDVFYALNKENFERIYDLKETDDFCIDIENLPEPQRREEYSVMIDLFLHDLKYNNDIIYTSCMYFGKKYYNMDCYTFGADDVTYRSNWLKYSPEIVFHIISDNQTHICNLEGIMGNHYFPFYVPEEILKEKLQDQYDFFKHIHVANTGFYLRELGYDVIVKYALKMHYKYLYLIVRASGIEAITKEVRNLLSYGIAQH